MDEAPSLPLPHRLGGTPYQLQQLLGAGAMGAVYLAEHADLRRLEVVKVLHPRHSQRPEIIGRFRQEARLASQLSHPALPIIFGLGTTSDGQHWIAMERLSGEDLRGYIRRRGQLPWREAADLAAQALDGLSVAHQAGILHRDIKPENLFRTTDGRVKVLDFGIAKPLEDQQATGVNTAFGMVLGTPRYMSPEQAKGNALGPPTDLYAIGCVLFEMLTGTPMVQGTEARELLRQHVYATPHTLAQRTGQAFDAQLEAIVARSVAKEPSTRFATASEMSSALRALLAPVERVVVTAPSSPPASYDLSSKATVRVDSVPPLAALPTDQQAAFATMPDPRGALTNPVPEAALLVGTATTQHGAHATAQTAQLPPGSVKATNSYAIPPSPSLPHDVNATSSPTQRLPDGVIDRSLNSEALARELSGARTTSASSRVSSLGLVLQIAGGIAILGVLVIGGVMLLGGGRDKKRDEASASAAKSEEVSSPKPARSEPEQPAGAPSGDVKRETEAAPTNLASDTAKPSITKPTTAPASDSKRPAATPREPIAGKSAPVPSAAAPLAADKSAAPPVASTPPPTTGKKPRVHEAESSRED